MERVTSEKSVAPGVKMQANLGHQYRYPIRNRLSSQSQCSVAGCAALVVVVEAVADVVVAL